MGLENDEFKWDELVTDALESNLETMIGKWAITFQVESSLFRSMVQAQAQAQAQIQAQAHAANPADPTTATLGR